MAQRWMFHFDSSGVFVLPPFTWFCLGETMWKIPFFQHGQRTAMRKLITIRATGYDHVYTVLVQTRVSETLFF